MANINAPRGFKPLRLVDGSPFVAVMNSYRLPSGYATAVAVGDVVKFLTTGYLAKAAAGDQLRGVVAGFQWTASDGTPKWAQVLPAGTVTQNAADIVVQVYDDPRIVYEALFTNSSTAPAMAQRGKLFNLIDAGVNLSQGLSGEGIDQTTQSTSSGQFRALQPVSRADNDTTSAYQRWEFVAALHDFRVNTGV